MQLVLPGAACVLVALRGMGSSFRGREIHGHRAQVSEVAMRRGGVLQNPGKISCSIVRPSIPVPPQLPTKN